MLRLALLSATLLLAGCAAPLPKSNRLPSDWAQGPFMEIFVRAYQDSDGDGKGDLKGLISRLDHIQALGVSGLWLMPITQSADRDHGYATTDFRAIEADYGSLADFDELMKQAHARGIGVVIDYVVNHGSHAHPLFQQAKSGAGNAYRDWFVWSDTAPTGWDIWGKYPWYWTGQQPWLWQGEVKDMPLAPAGSRDFYFGTFGPYMPDFNLKNEAVVRWHEDNLRFWLNRGLDGFRLDAVPHLVEHSAKDWNDQPESRQLTKRFYELISSYPERYTVCEATAEPQAYSSESVCGSAFAFGLERAILEALKAEKPEAMQQRVEKIGDFFKTRPHRMATMLANHDIFAGHRIWDQLKGDEAKYRLAAASYLLQPGIPFIYYGEEIGQSGLMHLNGDQPIRGPMSWTAAGGFSSSSTPYRAVSPNAASHNAQAQRADPNSLFHHYRQLVQLRRSEPALLKGSYEQVQVQGAVLSFVRKAQGQTLRVWLNYSEQPQSIDPRGSPVWAAPQSSKASTLPPWGVRVERL
jgi:alpha-amylase